MRFDLELTDSLQPLLPQESSPEVQGGMTSDLNFSYIFYVPRFLTCVSSMMSVEVCLLTEGFPRFHA